MLHTVLLAALCQKCEDMIEMLCYTKVYWQLFANNVRT